MNTTFKKELPLIIIVLLPFIYLFIIWNTLPSQVPMHWNLQGDIDRYGNKQELFIIPFALPFFIYIIMLVIPAIDPKGKLGSMGNKLDSLKLWLTTFMSLLACYIIYSAKERTLVNPAYFITAVGVLYLILGNYMKTIKPNYFLGIKTPWALESELNWKKTHQLAGVLWFWGGLLIVILSLLLTPQLSHTMFYIVTAILAIVPFIYSYLLYRKTAASA